MRNRHITLRLTEEERAQLTLRLRQARKEKPRLTISALVRNLLELEGWI